MGNPTVTYPTHTIADLFRVGQSLLRQAGIPHADREVAWILEHTLRCSAVSLHLDAERLVSDKEWNEGSQLLLRRAKREPLQYLLGTQEFCGNDFIVTPAVLIPRPETERVVQAALKCCGDSAVSLMVDVGTGSGCIAVALAKANPRAKVYATDMSGDALTVARENARRLQVEGQIDFLQGDLLEPLQALGLKQHIPLIVSNPPYIADPEWDTLQPEVAWFEPRIALEGGADGLVILRRVIEEAAAYLQGGGWLVLEVGQGQASLLKAWASDNTVYDHMETVQDQYGADRVLCLKRRKDRTLS